ncbi:MAG: DMT family transporter [Pseudomonadota bacterium]
MIRINRAQQGIAFVVCAMACFSMLDAAAKYIGASVPLVMAMWSRYTFQVFLTGAVLLPRRGRRLLVTRHPWLQLTRGVLMIVTSSLAFLSLQSMPMGDFTAILMLTPMLITLISVHSMGDKVTGWNWMLLVGGFIGAITVIRPGTADFQWATVYPLILVVLSAFFQLLTSYLARHDDPGTTQFYTGAVSFAIATMALPFFWRTPESVLLVVLLMMLGLFSTMGHYFMILGYGRASPATLTPFLYFQIAFAAFAGWLVFSDAPDRWSVIGIALITVCGIASSWLAGKTRPELVPTEPEH